jgi:DNA primase
LPVDDAGARRLRDELLGLPLAHAELDREQVHTILAASGAASLAEKLRRTRGLSFSFTRRDADPERAVRDLVLVIDTLAAQPGIDAALEAATALLMREDGDEAAFREQQRLLKARGEAERQLAALVESKAAEQTEQGV